MLKFMDYYMVDQKRCGWSTSKNGPIRYWRNSTDGTQDDGMENIYCEREA